MKQKENTVRIQVHCETSDRGYYSVQVRRKRFFIPYWDTIYEFLDVPGVWNPLLLKYDDAKSFALKAKDRSWLDSFNKEQLAIAKNYRDLRNQKLNRLYPTREQKF